MNQLDVYYRALLDYKKEVSENRDCINLRSSIAEADTENDKLVVTRSECTIDNDWVEAIEAGLIHIEKAIKEERQFIRSNGEVIPIEKVKNVSKDSVEHLARHSNLITRVTEGEDLIPDKLYTVERLNDYAVYENRFLYMLLCYLRDFVTQRYNNILDITNKYEGSLSVEKEISTAKSRMTYSLTMRDERRDDFYLKSHNSAQSVIDRIDLILKTILAFLATPLMDYASKAPMLKPPITKTNVLKMDNNFKGAVALYDFIIAYDKPGYITETKNVEISPFRHDLADEFAETAALTSFIAYVHGLGIEDDMKKSYLAENEKRKRAEIARRSEKIAALQRKVKNSGIGLEEYTLTLEKQLKALEAEASKILDLEATVAAMTEKEARLNENISSLNKTISEFDSVMNEAEKKHQNEMAEIKKSHTKEVESLNLAFREEITAINDKHSEEMKSECEKHKSEIDTLNQTINSTVDSCNQKISEANETVKNLTKERDSAIEERDGMTESLTLAEAKIKALRAKSGDKFSGEDYTSRDAFNKLEEEYKAFTKFYKNEWGKTKKRIRREILNIDNLKGKNDTGKGSDE